MATRKRPAREKDWGRRTLWRGCAISLALFLILSPGCLMPKDRGETIERDFRHGPGSGSALVPQSGNAVEVVDGCGAGPGTMLGSLEDVQQGSVSVRIARPDLVLHDATYRVSGEYSRELELPSKDLDFTVSWEDFVGHLRFSVECLR